MSKVGLIYHQILNVICDIEIESGYQPRGFAPGPPRLRRDRIFHNATSSHNLNRIPENVRCVPQRPMYHSTCITQQLTMRPHPQSPFGKAWAAHYKAADLARLSDEEKRVEYNRFSAGWEEKMGRSTPPTTAGSLDAR